MMPVFTIGHGTRTADELVDLLRAAQVERLCDVRRFPGSRRHPQFARASLEIILPAHGIAYEWWGGSLGGRRSRSASSRHPAWRVAAFQGYADYMDTPAFREAILALEDAVRGGTRVAVMCAETLWWRCHRRLISDALTLHGFEVIHLIGAGESQPHLLHAAARADTEGWPLYAAVRQDDGQGLLFEP